MMTMIISSFICIITKANSRVNPGADTEWSQAISVSTFLERYDRFGRVENSFWSSHGPPHLTSLEEPRSSSGSRVEVVPDCASNRSYTGSQENQAMQQNRKYQGHKGAKDSYSHSDFFPLSFKSQGLHNSQSA